MLELELHPLKYKYYNGHQKSPSPSALADVLVETQPEVADALGTLPLLHERLEAEVEDVDFHELLHFFWLLQGQDVLLGDLQHADNHGCNGFLALEKE